MGALTPTDATNAAGPGGGSAAVPGYSLPVDSLADTAGRGDDDRTVDLDPDDAPVLPEQTRDDTDRGWGGDPAADASNDERLLADRPPHWA